MPPIESDGAKNTCFPQDASDVLRAQYVQNMVKTATDNFQKIDTDGNGYINEKELTAAAAKAPAGSKEREYLQALQPKMWEVAALSNDSWGPEWSGMSRQDLAVLNQEAASMPRDMASAKAIRAVGEAKWPQLMGGYDDRIHEEDFNKAFARVKDASKCDWEALHAMQDQYESVHHMHAKIGSIKYEDLDEYPAQERRGFQLIFDLSPGSK